MTTLRSLASQQRQLSLRVSPWSPRLYKAKTRRHQTRENVLAPEAYYFKEAVCCVCVCVSKGCVCQRRSKPGNEEECREPRSWQCLLPLPPTSGAFLGTGQLLPAAVSPMKPSKVTQDRGRRGPCVGWTWDKWSVDLGCLHAELFPLSCLPVP